MTDTLGRLDADAGLLRLRLETLNRQLGTGRRTEAPGDLAPSLPRAAALRAEAGRRDIYGAAIGEALGRAQATQGALGRLSDIAREFAAGVAMKLDAGDPASIPLAAARARAALVEVGQLLNTSHAGEYLFGGSDSANPPVPAPEGLPASGLASQIAAAVAALGEKMQEVQKELDRIGEVHTRLLNLSTNAQQAVRGAHGHRATVNELEALLADLAAAL